MPQSLPELHPDFVQNMVRTFNNPDEHGVHLLFNEWWATAPEETVDRYVANYQAMEGAGAFLSSGYFAPQIDLETLQRMPVGSLGRGYFEFLSHNALEKNLATNYKQLHDYMASSGQLDRMPESMKYAIIRGFQIHDILHVVTGYTPSGLHELSLQAFCLAQLQFPYFGMWMATSTARMTFLQPDSIVPVMDAITQGWQYGRATPNLQFVRWEDAFERPLSEIRVQFSIPESTVASLAV